MHALSEIITGLRMVFKVFFRVVWSSTTTSSLRKWSTNLLILLVGQLLSTASRNFDVFCLQKLPMILVVFSTLFDLSSSGNSQRPFPRRFRRQLSALARGRGRS